MSSTYTVFRTDVETNRGKLVLHLRYSDFRKLYGEMKKVRVPPSLPPLLSGRRDGQCVCVCACVCVAATLTMCVHTWRSTTFFDEARVCVRTCVRARVRACLLVCAVRIPPIAGVSRVCDPFP